MRPEFVSRFRQAMRCEQPILNGVTGVIGVKPNAPDVAGSAAGPADRGVMMERMEAPGPNDNDRGVIDYTSKALESHKLHQIHPADGRKQADPPNVGVQFAELSNGPGPEADIREYVSAHYGEAFAALQIACPMNVPRERWRQAIDDAGLFLDQWGREAERLGWQIEELFGLHDEAPMRRYDRMGLIWILHGDSVTAINLDFAIVNRSLRFYRKPTAGKGRGVLR